MSLKFTLDGLGLGLALGKGIEDLLQGGFFSLVVLDWELLLQLPKEAEQETNTFAVVLNDLQLHMITFQKFNIDFTELVFNVADQLRDLTNKKDVPEEGFHVNVLLIVGFLVVI